VVTEGPAVGVSSGTTPPCNRDTATVETQFRHQHITMGTTGELLQAGDEAADGSVAVSPADQFTETVRGGLNRVGHVVNLEERERKVSAALSHRWIIV